MINISRLALVAAVTAVGLASPAFAQSFDPQIGGNIATPFMAQPIAPATLQPVHTVRRHAAPQSGLNSFAMVPAFTSGQYDPALTGGGSLGYNEKLHFGQ